MATKVLDLCIRVDTQPVTLEVSANGSATRPTEPPYWFQVYWAQDEPASSQGEAVELAQTGECRVVVWDQDPGTTYDVFTQPTWQDESVLVNLSGGAYTLASADPDNPWPTT